MKVRMLFGRAWGTKSAPKKKPKETARKVTPRARKTTTGKKRRGRATAKPSPEAARMAERQAWSDVLGSVGMSRSARAAVDALAAGKGSAGALQAAMRAQMGRSAVSTPKSGYGRRQTTKTVARRVDAALGLDR